MRWGYRNLATLSYNILFYMVCSLRVGGGEWPAKQQNLWVNHVTATNAEKQKARKSGLFNKWLGYEDSNLGMAESESAALPLGDTPTGCVQFPGRLLIWLGYEDSNLGMVESESTALPLGDTPRKWWLRRESNL